MKYFTLLLPILLMSCGHQTPESKAPKSPLSAHSQSPTSTPKEIVNTTVKNQTYISTKDVLRCLDSDKKQNIDNEMCLLAWAANPEKNPELDSLIMGFSLNSRNMLLAAIARKSPLRNLDFTLLEHTISLLDQQPNWLKLYFLRIWYSYHADPAINIYLRNYLKQIPLIYPRDFKEKYELDKLLLQQSHGLESKDFCINTSLPSLNSRCLRYISVLPKQAFFEDHFVKRALTLMTTEDLNYFRVTFPKRWILLKPNMEDYL